MNKRWSRSALVLVATMATISAGAATATATVSSASRAVPLPKGLMTGGLDDVSCATSGFCVGVGSARSRHGRWTALIERWNGASWTPMRPALHGQPPATELFGVDCRTKSYCVAVGYADKRRGYTSVIERWNGRHWTVMPNPNPTGRSQIELGSVSCPASDWCMAVGSSANPNGPSYALVERWNGSEWSITRIDHWKGASDNQLLDVSCPTTHACFSVGLTAGGQSALIQNWNGHTWSPHVLNDDDFSGLGSVFCFSARSCLAAGGLGDSGGNSDYLERWNGRSWKMDDAASWNEGQLYGVGCSRTVRFCAAVGDNVETWTGGSDWSYQPLVASVLQGVSCAKQMCMAVGGSSGNVEKPVSLLIRDR